MRRYDSQARDIIVSRLNKMGLHCPTIQGTIHAFPDLTSVDRSSERAATILLEQCGVACTPGVAFGGQGEGRVRFSFGAVPHEELVEAMDRLEKLGA
jgi:aminotransferase